jgi:hypothetical protein
MDHHTLQYRPNYDPNAVQYMRDELTAIGKYSNVQFKFTRVSGELKEDL